VKTFFCYREAMVSFLKRWGISNPWVWVFFVTLALQIFRGSPIDTMIFGSSTVLIWLDAVGFLKKSLRERPKVSNSTIAIVVAMYGISLSVFPRHSYEHGALVLSILPIALWLVWYRDRGPKERPDPLMAKTKVVWIVLCIAICIWEFAANIQGQLENNLYSHPTISILMDPFMDSTFGKSIFAVIWLLAGVGLLRIWGRK
jgi:hypothetical protein